MSPVWFALIISYILIILLGAAIFFLWVEVKAMNKSTHQVTYVDPFSTKQTTQEFDKIDGKTKEALTKSMFDNLT